MAIFPQSRPECLRHERVQAKQQSGPEECQDVYENASQADRSNGDGAVG